MLIRLWCLLGYHRPDSATHFPLECLDCHARYYRSGRLR